MFTFTWHLLLEISQEFYKSIFVEIWRSLPCKDQYLLCTSDALENCLFFFILKEAWSIWMWIGLHQIISCVLQDKIKGGLPFSQIWSKYFMKGQKNKIYSKILLRDFAKKHKRITVSLKKTPKVWKNTPCINLKNKMVCVFMVLS